jgi:hypothetical protein
MNARIWECTNAQYHADNSKIGSSMLRTALESLRKYNRMYVDLDPPEKRQTPEQLLGSVVHCLLLEPEAFDSIYCVRPDVDGRTVEGKKALAEFRSKQPGKMEISFDVHEKAKLMHAVLMQEDEVQSLLAGSVKERAILWDVEDLTFKCKPDIFYPCEQLEFDWVIDYKTSSDPTPENWLPDTRFGPISTYGYDLQGAHYTAGVVEYTNKPCRFGTIVQGTSDPFDVFLYDLTSRIPRGHGKRVEAIDRIVNGVKLNWRRPDQGVLLEVETRDYNN